MGDGSKPVGGNGHIIGRQGRVLRDDRDSQSPTVGSTALVPSEICSVCGGTRLDNREIVGVKYLILVKTSEGLGMVEKTDYLCLEECLPWIDVLQQLSEIPEESTWH